MKVKEKVIRESIKRIENRIYNIDKILGSNPLSEICEGRIKAQNIMKDNKADYEKISKLISTLAKKEKDLFKLAKMQNRNTSKYIKEKVELESELSSLNHELHIMILRGVIS